MAELVPVMPHLLALFNVSTVVLLLLGFVAIRRGARGRHRQLMLGAVAAAVLFLITYLTYHAQIGNVKFAGEGGVRWVYFTILIAHVVMAAVMVPLIPMMLFRALGERFDAHRRLARKALPVWLFVSVTGVVVYVLAFHIYPAA